MMQMTTISSIRVSPLPERGTEPRTGALTVAAKRRLPQITDREKDSEREYQHQYAEQHDQDGLDLRRERLQLVLDLALIHLGHLAQQLVQLARLLAHGDHLQHNRRENSGRDGGPQQAFAALDAVADLLDALRDVGVVDDLLHHREGLHDGYAAFQRDRERARKPGEGRLEDDFPRYGNAKLHAVPGVAACRRADPNAEHNVGAGGNTQQRRPVLDHEVGKREQHPGHERQPGLEARKNARKGRDHEDVDDDQSDRHHYDHEGRVAQRLGDLVLDLPFELEVVEQPQEDFFQRTGELAHAHHADIER